MSVSRQAYSAKRAARLAGRVRKPASRFDDASGYWLVPMSDSHLDLLSAGWSEPVQLRAVSIDGGETYELRVRDVGDGAR